MKFIQNKKSRRSIRLKYYDYSQPGGYFVTICTQGFRNLFGEVVDGKMKLNVGGQVVEKWWSKLPEKFPGIEIDDHVTMPNHFHGIIYMNVGAATWGRPYGGSSQQPPVGAPPCGCPIPPNQGRPHGVAPTTLFSIIEWFKTMTTNEYIFCVKMGKFPKFSKRLWQRNYYEHIIRDEDELNRIREYIQNNPAKWAEDKYFVN